MELIWIILGLVMFSIVISLVVCRFISDGDQEYDNQEYESPWEEAPCSWCGSPCILSRDAPDDYKREMTCSEGCKDEKRKHYNDNY